MRKGHEWLDEVRLEGKMANLERSWEPIQTCFQGIMGCREHGMCFGDVPVERSWLGRRRQDL